MSKKEKDLKLIYDNPFHIKNIEDPDIEMQLTAVKKNGSIIQYIK